jgi:hypothetical protein
MWASHSYQHTAGASTLIPLLLMHVVVGGICLAALPDWAVPGPEVSSARFTFDSPGPLRVATAPRCLLEADIDPPEGG